MDITQLILEDHAEQRRLFALIDEIDPADKTSLAAIWGRLGALLDTHAEAEERLFYPALLELGEGIDAKHPPEEETEDAIGDHNDIRDAVADAEKHDVGSDAWYAAVAAANKANGDHMAEEEREGLADFRRHASLQVRHDLGLKFATFDARHITGVERVDKDPEEYIAEHTP